MSSLTQGGRSVHEFARQVKECSNMAYPAVEATRDSVALMTFLNGLRKDIRQDVRKMSPTTLADAIRIASTHEAIFTMEKNEENHQLINAVALLTDSVRQMNTWNDNDRHARRDYDRRSSSRDQSRDRESKTPYWKTKSYQPRRNQGHQDQRRRQNTERHNDDDYRRNSQQRRSPSRDPRHQEPQNRSSGGRRTGNNPRNNGPRYSTNFLFAAIVLSLICASSGREFFDCSHQVGGIFMTMPNTPNCSTTPKEAIETREVDLYVWLDQETSTTAWRCTKETYRR
ncbi:hypothetical protein B9Z55_028251 [Caenorhabditis nigoni]|uniref:Uncharacterized protein n=1 Tax=Caenorhabditis nigoni TaxID=1611254 RepID=A0A2G5SCU7_9PELO|nr:hypothetical protein B9Z55_028251 [Caenorhabditis nigoni]